MSLKERFDTVFDKLSAMYINGRINLDDYDRLYNMLIDVERGARDSVPYAND